MTILAIATATLLAPALHAQNAQPAAEQFHIQTRILAITPESLTAPVPDDKALTPEAIARQIAPVLITKNSEAPAWIRTGKSMPSNVSVASAPSLLVNDNQNASISMMSPVAYMSRESDGRFTLHEDTTRQSGLEVRVLAARQPTGMIRIKTELHATTVASRTPIHDVPLDIGKADAMGTASTETVISMREGDTLVLPGPLDDTGSRLVMVVQIAAMPKPG